jgi:hypothetical protein
MIPELRIKSSTPGSYAAQLAGCLCDAKANCYGLGAPSDRLSWVTHPACDMHGTPERFDSLPTKVLATSE